MKIKNCTPKLFAAAAVFSAMIGVSAMADPAPAMTPAMNAVPTWQTLYLMNASEKVAPVKKELEIYNINGNNYMKVRDLGYLMDFSVTYDKNLKGVSITKHDHSDGVQVSNEKAPSVQDAKAAWSPMYVEGQKVDDISMYNINGNNFVKIRDLAGTVGFGCVYSPELKAVVMSPYFDYTDNDVMTDGAVLHPDYIDGTTNRAFARHDVIKDEPATIEEAAIAAKEAEMDETPAPQLAVKDTITGPIDGEIDLTPEIEDSFTVPVEPPVSFDPTIAPPHIKDSEPSVEVGGTITGPIDGEIDMTPDIEDSFVVPVDPVVPAETPAPAPTPEVKNPESGSSSVKNPEIVTPPSDEQILDVTPAPEQEFDLEAEELNKEAGVSGPFVDDGLAEKPEVPQNTPNMPSKPQAPSVENTKPEPSVPQSNRPTIKPGMSVEEIQDILNGIVEQGMTTIRINTRPNFASGTADGCLDIVNESSNHYAQRVDIILKSTGEKIFESGLIPVGGSLKRACLDTVLEAGDYECTAFFNNIDSVTGAVVGTAGAEMTIHIAS